MAKKCQICGKPATVHFTQIVNNEMKNVDLCDECAERNGLFDLQGASLAMLAALGESLFNGLKQSVSAFSGVICSVCGHTPVMFKESGRLGCPNCYKDLKVIVDRLIESSQKGVCHVGKKLPQKSNILGNEIPSIDVDAKKSKKTSAKDKLSELQSELERAIADERYEDAARIRDEIKKYKK